MEGRCVRMRISARIATAGGSLNLLRKAAGEIVGTGLHRPVGRGAVENRVPTLAKHT